ncbi:exosortase/archaeosortase family protein [Verrucomicrobiota bacterium]
MSASRVLALAVLALMFWLLYGVQGNSQETAIHGHSAVRWMVKRWSGSGGDLSHGWVIPLVSLYLLWRRRRDLVSAEKQPAAAGLAVVVLALFLHWAGVRAQLTRLSLLSLIGLLWGIPLYFYGWKVAGLILFPCVYLFFCIPLSFLNSITVPLRLFAGGMATFLLNGLGIATVRQGTAIYSSAAGGFNLDVADACSGLRSMLAMTALTAAYAYLTQDSLVKKWLLFAGAVPLAIAGNVARVVTIAVVAGQFGEEAALRIYHDYSGYIVFAVAVLLMMGLGRVLKTDYREKLRGWSPHRSADS